MKSSHMKTNHMESLYKPPFSFSFQLSKPNTQGSPGRRSCKRREETCLSRCSLEKRCRTNGQGDVKTGVLGMRHLYRSHTQFVDGNRLYHHHYSIFSYPLVKIWFALCIETRGIEDFSSKKLMY